MFIRLCASLFVFWLLVARECGAFEPGYYPPKNADPEDGKQSAFRREFQEAQKNADAVLYVDSIDRIRILRKKLTRNDNYKWHTRDEVTASLKSFDPKELLIAWIGTSAMWSGTEKRNTLVRKVEPFMEKLGFARVVVMGFDPHDDGKTLMNPSNGALLHGIFVFKDTNKSRLEK